MSVNEIYGQDLGMVIASIFLVWFLCRILSLVINVFFNSADTALD